MIHESWYSKTIRSVVPRDNNAVPNRCMGRARSIDQTICLRNGSSRALADPFRETKFIRLRNVVESRFNV